MTRIHTWLLILVLSLGGRSGLYCQQVFEVDLIDRSDDEFKVTLYPEHLLESNAVFQFASTAPGTYVRMDIGRFVRDFKAFDRSGSEVPTEHSSTNQWTLSRPADIRKITYSVDDIWHSDIRPHPIYAMCTSTISDDFVMINGQAVFGYFTGMQTEPIRIKLMCPAAWKIGTALARDTAGYYVADDFDHVVDSPIYLGALTTASTRIDGAAIDVYTYSMTNLISSDTMLASLQRILTAESDFMKGLPVDRYVFLFYFGQFSAGAWEHSYCSEYVFKEDSLTAMNTDNIVSTVAHEFFHVNVPLHIHSELVEHFNFVKPVMSQHLWLYEGTTEWAADMLQLRDSLITLGQYLQRLQTKFTTSDAFDPDLSLTRLGVHATELEDQYPNIYQKGALVSALLDIRLLQLSHGTMGLRDVLLSLSQRYGKHHAFSEEHFFDELVAMTYPEIREFIDSYIKGTEKLPVKEYFGWLGIAYNEHGEVDSTMGSLRAGMRPRDSVLVVTMVYDDSGSKLKKGDVVMKIDDTPATFKSIRKLFAKVTAMHPGSVVRITVNRGGKEMELASVVEPRLTRHVLAPEPSPTADQLQLRMKWMHNN